MRIRGEGGKRKLNEGAGQSSTNRDKARKSGLKKCSGVLEKPAKKKDIKRGGVLKAHVYTAMGIEDI